jgi:exopolysaccharide biosynthesis operon protein EpsL
MPKSTTRMPAIRIRLLPLLALALGLPMFAQAEGADDLTLSATVGQMRDSNLFRLPSNLNLLPFLGRSSAAETISTTALGLNYQRSYSLQKVELDVGITDYRYQNFGYLSFLAKNYRAAWDWSYTPHLYGQLSTRRNQSLNSFTDFRGFNQQNVRNQTQTAFDATYELDARWRLKGGLSRSALVNSAVVTGEADNNRTTVEAGVRYVLPSGSLIGYRLATSDGTYTTNRALPSAGFYDVGYTQTDNQLLANWAISRSTAAEFMLGQRRFTHPNYPQRDFSGMLASANLRWSYSGKSALVAGWTRDTSSFETNDFNYSQTDRFSIGPVWQLSPKATVQLQLAHAVRDFKGTPFGVVSAQRRDTTNDASLSFSWEPYRFLLLSASLQNARRSSTAPGLDYTSNMININAQFSY